MAVTLAPDHGTRRSLPVTGGAVPPERQAMLRAAANHACRSAARVVDMAYTTAGSTSVYVPSPLQRHFRDVHTVTQHFFHSDEIDEMAGRVLIGADDDSLSRL